MGIAHFLDIRHKLVCHVTVGIEVAVVVHFPRACVNLVDVDGRLIDVGFFSLPKPRRVAPLIAVKLVILRSRSGSCFAVESVRVSLVNLFTVCGYDMVFIVVINADIGNKALPDAAVVELFHRSGIYVPVVEVTDDTDAFCVRRPHTERIEIAFALRLMRAEIFVRLDVFSLIKEVQSDIIAVCLFRGHFMHRPVCFIDSGKQNSPYYFYTIQ